MTFGGKQPNATALLSKTRPQRKLRNIQFQVIKDDPIYPGMRKLKLRGRDLEHMPHEVFTMTDIEVLDLSPEREACLFYQLTEVPTAISKLFNLKVLMLDTNDLLELPIEICKLPQLERLSLSNNHLQNLPSEFSNLAKLRSLHLSNNELVTIPDAVLKLQELEFLDISDNEITDIPVNVSSLANLNSLLLFFNKLSALPDAICDLVELRCLWIGGNNIEKLPRNFGKLKHLDWGISGHHTVSAAIGGNPLREPPPEVCLRGVYAISEYFASRSGKAKTDRKAYPGKR